MSELLLFTAVLFNTPATTPPKPTRQGSRFVIAAFHGLNTLGKVMKQSAVRWSLCLLSVMAATTAVAESVDSSLPTRAQVVREWSAGIRSNANKATKEINRDAIKAGLQPAALKLELPTLSDSSERGEPVAMVTRRNASRPNAD